MRVRLAALVIGLTLFANVVRAEESLLPESRFASVDAFVAAVKAFKPASSSGSLGYLFSATELGQPEEPKTGAITRAEAINSCTKIWSDDHQALVFAVANPRTEATPSCVGVLFLLQSNEKEWRIVNQRVFHASGKYARVECKISSYYGKGYSPTSDTLVLTIKEQSGGRGEGCELSRSYRLSAQGIIPADLE